MSGVTKSLFKIKRKVDDENMLSDDSEDLYS